MVFKSQISTFILSFSLSLSLCASVIAADVLECGGSTPLSHFNNSSADPDHDGFSTEIELILGTDPSDPKSRPTLADNQYKVLGYWPLTEDAQELFGSGADGELFGGASFDGSLLLDGKTGYINFDRHPIFNITKDLSISLWLNPYEPNRMQRLLGKYANTGANRDYALFMMAGRLSIFLSEDGTNDEEKRILLMTKPHTIQEDAWNHIAFTWDSSQGTEGVTCMINGTGHTLSGDLSGDFESIHSGTAPFTLGTYDLKENSGNKKKDDKIQNAFNGGAAGLLISDQALTDLEMRELYYLGRQGDLPLYLNTDFDQDGMPDWWERRYFHDIVPDAGGDFDDDGVTNLGEYQKNTDPTSEDTDKDGFVDSYDNQVSRVYIDGDIDFTQDNAYVYPGPDWLKGVWKEGGEWHSWYVGPAEPDNTGALFIELDRTILNDNVVMEIEYLKLAGSTLYVDLLDANHQVIAQNIFGDIIAGTDNIISSYVLGGEEYVRKMFDVPLADNPDAAIIKIYRGTGEMLVLEVTLYVDQDCDGLDAGQEAMLKTSDLNSDSDGDGLNDGQEVFVYQTDPTEDDTLLDNDGDGVSNVDEILRGTGLNDPTSASIIIYADSTAGNDTWDGYARLWEGVTRGPKKTIGGAINTAITGDTVEAASGTYQELPAIYDLMDKSVTLIPQGSVVIE